MPMPSAGYGCKIGEYQHDDKDERHRGQQEIAGFDRQAGGIGADTIEHMPPIQMFRLRQRPKGMEYPACRGCNNGSQHLHPCCGDVFPSENYEAPRSWTERAYHKLIYYNKAGKGGHFAAWEQPQLFSEEVRAGFRPLRT